MGRYCDCDKYETVDCVELSYMDTREIDVNDKSPKS